jgi:hypothetical protein
MPDSRFKRKLDLLSIATFASHSGREWLLHGAFDALHREGLGEPAYLAESLRPHMRWVVADAFDALRLETLGFPAIATEGITTLSSEDTACHWIILLQRPGEEASMGGLDVREELLGLGWTGTLTEITLPFDNLDEAESECGPHGLATFIVSLITHAKTQELRGEDYRAQPIVTNQRAALRPYQGYTGYRPYRGDRREVSTHG